MKNIIKVILLATFLFIISFLIITINGKIYTISFDYNKDSKLTIEEESGKIEIIDEKIKENKYIIKEKGKEKGKVYIFFGNNEIQTGKQLYIHKNMVITEDNYLGKSTSSESIPISISIILLYILFLLIKKYKKCLKENIYQYKNISYLGIIIFLFFSIINNIFSIFNYQGLFETVNRIISSLSFASVILLPIAFITFVLVTISNIILIIKE